MRIADTLKQVFAKPDNRILAGLLTVPAIIAGTVYLALPEVTAVTSGVDAAMRDDLAGPLALTEQIIAVFRQGVVANAIFLSALIGAFGVAGLTVRRWQVQGLPLLSGQPRSRHLKDAAAAGMVAALAVVAVTHYQMGQDTFSTKVDQLTAQKSQACKEVFASAFQSGDKDLAEAALEISCDEQSLLEASLDAHSGQKHAQAILGLISESRP